jgi:anti-anti-sigma factor
MKQIAELSVDQDDRVVIVRLRGEIDLSNAEALRLQIEEAVPNHAIGLIVELSLVRYLDSSGIRLLFELARRLERRQQRLVTVVEEDSPVGEILEMVEANERLNVRHSLPEAETAFTSSP